jgi:hypothetical protein
MVAWYLVAMLGGILLLGYLTQPACELDVGEHHIDAMPRLQVGDRTLPRVTFENRQPCDAKGVCDIFSHERLVFDDEHHLWRGRWAAS